MKNSFSQDRPHLWYLDLKVVGPYLLQLLTVVAGYSDDYRPSFLIGIPSVFPSLLPLYYPIQNSYGHGPDNSYGDGPTSGELSLARAYQQAAYFQIINNAVYHDMPDVISQPMREMTRPGTRPPTASPEDAATEAPAAAADESTTVAGETTAPEAETSTTTTTAAAAVTTVATQAAATTVAETTVTPVTTTTPKFSAADVVPLSAPNVNPQQPVASILKPQGFCCVLPNLQVTPAPLLGAVLNRSGNQSEASNATAERPVRDFPGSQLDVGMSDQHQDRHSDAGLSEQHSNSQSNVRLSEKHPENHLDTGLSEQHSVSKSGTGLSGQQPGSQSAALSGNQSLSQRSRPVPIKADLDKLAQQSIINHDRVGQMDGRPRQLPVPERSTSTQLRRITREKISCTVLQPTTQRFRPGTCEDKKSVREKCDGMMIKRTKECGPQMTCCASL